MTDLFKKFKTKIKSIDEILLIIGTHPRKISTIICHGVFDVVHPGHVRHLAYAKSKADLLIVSLTADQYIEKGAHRPHVPQDIRALNIAAFEMVDYVVIDENAKPLSLLSQIKPEYFAKGFEYVANDLALATKEEQETVNSYGGEIIFTPGDVVYSSSKLLEMSPPNIKSQKTQMLMERSNLTFEGLRQTVRSFGGAKVHVIGDTIVDTYTRTSLIGGQTKTPTFSVLCEGREDYVGGAGIVAKHLRAAGADVTFSTVLGADCYGDFVIETLNDANISTLQIIDKSRPTTNKNVFIADGYRLLKVDTLDNRSISNEVLDKIIDQIQRVDAEIIVFSDFRHGIFNRLTIQKLIDAIPEAAFRVADSQVASRWGNIIEFQKFDLITPNEREARFALADQDSTVGHLAGRIIEATAAKSLILKLGSRGAFCMTPYPDNYVDNETKNFFSLDSFADDVADSVGAGDALLAYATLSLYKTGSMSSAAILGSLAAACECARDGNIPITAEDTLKKIDSLESQLNYE
tara:strand:+ start:4595 stop:6154 length:1560 start_codon:yes stop_codon:yes gene_type:complete